MGPLGPALGCSWGFFGDLGLILGCLGTSWGHLGPSGLVLGRSWGFLTGHKVDPKIDPKTDQKFRSDRVTPKVAQTLYARRWVRAGSTLIVPR